MQALPASFKNSFMLFLLKTELTNHSVILNGPLREREPTSNQFPTSVTVNTVQAALKIPDTSQCTTRNGQLIHSQYLFGMDKEGKRITAVEHHTDKL